MDGNEKRERVEVNFRNVKAKNGTFSPHIGKATTDRLTKYCHNRNINRTKFVERCVNERLDVLESEYYYSLSKDEPVQPLTKR